MDYYLSCTKPLATSTASRYFERFAVSPELAARVIVELLSGDARLPSFMSVAHAVAEAVSGVPPMAGHGSFVSARLVRLLVAIGDQAVMEAVTEAGYEQLVQDDDYGAISSALAAEGHWTEDDPGCQVLAAGHASVAERPRRGHLYWYHVPGAPGPDAQSWWCRTTNGTGCRGRCSSCRSPRSIRARCPRRSRSHTRTRAGLDPLRRHPDPCQGEARSAHRPPWAG